MKIILSSIIVLCILTGFVGLLIRVFSDTNFSLKVLFGGLLIIMIITFI